MKYVREIEQDLGDAYQEAYSRLVDSYFKFGITPAVTGYLKEEAIFAYNRMPIELKASAADGLQKILEKIDNLPDKSKLDLVIRKITDS